MTGAPRYHGSGWTYTDMKLAASTLAKFEQIKEAKRVEMRERNGNAKLFLVEAMKNANIYVNGTVCSESSQPCIANRLLRLVN